MRFRFLGQLEVFDGSRWVGIGAARWRSLLAALLIRSNDVVSFDQLIFELWGDSPPKSAPTQIHGYVMRLRRAIGEPNLLITAPSGYRLVVDPDDVDALCFGTLAEQGEAALRAGDADNAAALLNRALALWRGAALSDIPPSAQVTAVANRLAEQRLVAWEARVDADLERGRHAGVIGELTRHVKDHPLREQSWRQLMLALYRSGRQAEALQAYRRLRRTLVDEIGVEPCAAVQQLHQRLLAAEQLPADSIDVTPYQLPADVPDFTGRVEPLAAVARTLAGRRPVGSPPVAVVFGSPGVGKSTLAVRAARAASTAFPDGQLFLDLAGTSAQPREPAGLLADVVHALGVSGASIPDSLHARATLYRSLLSSRRILLVLDDAAGADQVRHLLPPNGNCAVVITSRHLLTDLVGARHIELDVFTAAESRQLFASVVGMQRTAREPEQAAAILNSCGHLPLAIRIAAGKLVGRPAWSLRMLSDRLDNESRRLSVLRLGELSVRASFELSLRLLPEEAVRAFQLLGLLGAQAVPGWIVGPLLGRPDAEEILDVLVDANLVRLTTIDRTGQPLYRLPDLLRAYAVDGAESIPMGERTDAVARVLAISSWSPGTPPVAPERAVLALQPR